MLAPGRGLRRAPFAELDREARRVAWRPGRRASTGPRAAPSSRARPREDRRAAAVEWRGAPLRGQNELAEHAEPGLADAGEDRLLPRGRLGPAALPGPARARDRPAPRRPRRRLRAGACASARTCCAPAAGTRPGSARSSSAMAEAGVAIAAARRELVRGAEAGAGPACPTPFPRPRAAPGGRVESWLPSVPALEAEERLAALLAAARAADAETGGAADRPAPQRPRSPADAATGDAGRALLHRPAEGATWSASSWPRRGCAAAAGRPADAAAGRGRGPSRRAPPRRAARRPRRPRRPVPGSPAPTPALLRAAGGRGQFFHVADGALTPAMTEARSRSEPVYDASLDPGPRRASRRCACGRACTSATPTTAPACTTWCSRSSTTRSTRRWPAMPTGSRSRINADGSVTVDRQWPRHPGRHPRGRGRLRRRGHHDRAARRREVQPELLQGLGRPARRRRLGRQRAVGLAATCAIWRDGHEHYDAVRGRRRAGGPARRWSGRRAGGAAPRSPSCPRSRSSPTTEFSYDTLEHRLRELAFLNSGVRIVLQRPARAEPREEELHYEGGLEAFVATSTARKQRAAPADRASRGERDGITVEVGPAVERRLPRDDACASPTTSRSATAAPT